jgi:hypothetical protein
LRLRLDVLDGTVVQRILPGGSRVPVTLLCADPGAEVERLVLEAARTPMDLYGDGPMRVTLIQQGEHGCDVLVVVHHLASDNWSQEILETELITAYRAVAAGRRPILPALRTDWTRHVRAQLDAGPDLTAAQWAYWSAEALPSSSLTVPAAVISQPGEAGGDAPAPRAWAVALILDELPGDAGAVIGDYARDIRVTPATVWQTLLLLAISRAFDSGDFLYYYMHHGRDLRGTDALVGFFARSVVLRFTSAGADSLTDLCRATLGSVTTGVRASRPPFRITRLSDRLEAEPGFAQSRLKHPLSTVTINIQPRPACAGARERPGPPAGPPVTPPFAVRKSRLWFWLDVSDRTELTAHFDRRKFPPDLIEAVFAHLAALVRELPAGPRRTR